MKKKSQKLRNVENSPSAIYTINHRSGIILLKAVTIVLLFIASLFSGCQKQLTPNTKPPLSVSSQSLSATTITTGNIWYDKFANYEASAGAVYYNSTNAATLGWSESYMLRSYVTLYEVTKDVAWLNKLTTHVDAIIANTTDTDGDGFLDWKTSDYSAGNYPYLVFDGLISLPIAQFVRLVNQNPTTLATFATKATSYKTFIETQIVPKWVTTTSYVGNCWVQLSTSTGYFKEPTTFDSLPGAVFTPLPYNMMAAYAEMLWTMYDVNGNTSYRDKANQIVQYFKNGLTTNGTGYNWWYCNIASPHIEDTSHGNLDAEMAIESFNRGGTITGTVIQGLSNTLTTNMWNQSVTAPLVKDNVDGTGTTYSNTKLLTGWTGMTQFNAAAWTIAAEQFRSIAPSSFNHAFTMAQIIAWDPVKVQNQGFEYEFFSDLTLPARWTRLGSPATSIQRYTADKYSGQACAAITSTTGDATWQGLYQDWKQWEPSTTYVITFNVKTSGTAGARVFIYNTTTSTVVGTTHDYDSAAWSTQTFTFTTPAAGPALRLYLENHDLSTAGTAYFDNVVIKKSGEAF
jgi:hypothetical protein